MYLLVWSYYLFMSLPLSPKFHEDKCGVSLWKYNVPRASQDDDWHKGLKEKSKGIMITTNGNNWNLTFRELLPKTAQFPRATFHFAWVSDVMKTLLGKQNPEWIRDCWESPCSRHFFSQLVRNVSHMWIWFLFIFKCGYPVYLKEWYWGPKGLLKHSENY